MQTAQDLSFSLSSLSSLPSLPSLPSLVSSPAAAVGGVRAAAQLDVTATRDLVVAGRAARSGGLVVAAMVLTAGAPMALVLSGAFPEHVRAIQAVGLACWLLSTAQGLALFLARRRAFVAVCAEHALAPPVRADVERWLAATEQFDSRSIDEQADALLAYLRARTEPLAPDTFETDA